MHRINTNQAEKNDRPKLKAFMKSSSFRLKSRKGCTKELERPCSLWWSDVTCREHVVFRTAYPFFMTLFDEGVPYFLLDQANRLLRSLLAPSNRVRRPFAFCALLFGTGKVRL